MNSDDVAGEPHADAVKSDASVGLEMPLNTRPDEKSLKPGYRDRIATWWAGRKLLLRVSWGDEVAVCFGDDGF